MKLSIISQTWQDTNAKEVWDEIMKNNSQTEIRLYLPLHDLEPNSIWFSWQFKNKEGLWLWDERLGNRAN